MADWLVGAWCSVKLMHSHVNPKNGEEAPLIADDVYEIIMAVRGREREREFFWWGEGVGVP